MRWEECFRSTELKSDIVYEAKTEDESQCDSHHQSDQSLERFAALLWMVVKLTLL